MWAQINKLLQPLNRQSVFFILTAFVALALPWAHSIANYGIIALVVYFLFDKKLLNNLKEIRRNKLALLYLAFFLWNLLSFFFNNNHDGATTLQIRLSFLLFPLVFGTTHILSREQLKGVLSFNIIGCSVAILICELIGIYKYVNNGFTNNHVLIYELLAYPLMHPGFLSIHIFFAIVIACQQLVFSEEHTYLSKKFLGIFIVLALLFIGQLTSKSVFIVFAAYCIWLAYKVVKSNLAPHTKRLALLGSLGAIPLFVLIVRLLIWDRFKYIFVEFGQLGTNVAFNNSSGSRLQTWLEGIKLLPNKLFGYGVGQGNPVILARLKEHGYDKLVAAGMHTHNQFLKYGLELGILGLSFFAFILIVSIVYCIRTKNNLGMWLLFLLIMSCLTDDCLDVQNGVIFFIFFIAVLIINNGTLKKQASMTE
jgi:O-antigen ligase